MFTGHPEDYFVVSVDVWFNGGKGVKASGGKDGLGVASCSPSAATRAMLWASASWSGALG